MIALLVSRALGALGFQILSVWLSFRIYQATHSALAVGTLGLSFFFANAAALLIGGALADRLSRRVRHALFAIQLAIALLAAATFLCAEDHPSLLLLAGGAANFLRPLRSVLYLKTLSEKVSGGVRSAWIAKWNAVSWQLALFAGPFLFSQMRGGTTIASLCLFLSAFLVLIEGRTAAPPTPLPDSAPEEWLEAIRAGYRAFRNAKTAFLPWATDSIVTLFVGIGALFPFLLAKNGLDPGQIGTARAMVAAGSLVASGLLPVHWIARHARGLFGFSLISVGIAAAFFSQPLSYLAFLGLAALSGALDGISVVVRDEWLLRCVPRRKMGSIGAITSLMISVSDDLGDFRSGLFAQTFGLDATVLFGAAVSVVAGICYLAFSARDTPSTIR